MYVFRFRLLAFVLIFSLCFSVPVWAVNYSDLYDSSGYAKQVDTYSLFPFASASNVPVASGLNDYINPASSVGSVNNTVDFSGCVVDVYDSVSKKYLFASYVSVGGTFSYIVPSGVSVTGFQLRLSPSASLPSYGKYLNKVDFASDLDYGGYSNFSIYTYWKQKNQTGRSSYHPISGFLQSSGDIYSEFNVDIASNVESFNYSFGLKEAVGSGAGIGGKFSISFTGLSSSSGVDYTTAGQAPSSGEIQSDIANTTTQINYSVNQVYDSILALTQHISDQLAAFWDQLYNYIHVPTFNKLQEILKAIQAIQLKVNVDVSSVVDAVDTSADRISNTVNSAINSQISNDNKNTDDLKNGYDNSGMLSDNDRLNDKISQYDEVEDQLFNDAKDKIGNFTFDNPLSKYTAVLSDISYFLAGIYEGLGALNIPIGFSLTLTIALIFIGYYRFKGGV